MNVAFFAFLVTSVVARYVVKLANHRTDGQFSVQSLNASLAKVQSVSRSSQTVTFGGFSAMIADIDDEEQVSNIARDPNVQYIVPVVDYQLYAPIPQSPPQGPREIPSGIDRLDQQDLPLDGKYVAPPKAGEGAIIYVLDSGIDAGHPGFGGRAELLYNAIQDGDDVDYHGHGTHVAGTAAADRFGVAPRALVKGIKVCDGNGSCPMDALVRGLGYAVRDMQARGIHSAVCNLSLGAHTGDGPDPFGEAVNEALETGMVVVAASGNEDQDACMTSPAKIPRVLTVNAATFTDEATSFSNYGRCSDIYAPGEVVTSLAPGGGISNQSGTSMASPHVAGVAALIISEYPNMTPDQVKKMILESSLPGKIEGAPGDTPNRLLQVPRQVYHDGLEKDDHAKVPDPVNPEPKVPTDPPLEGSRPPSRELPCDHRQGTPPSSPSPDDRPGAPVDVESVIEFFREIINRLGQTTG